MKRDVVLSAIVSATFFAGLTVAASAEPNEGLVWGLYLMVQHPERCTTPDFPENGCEAITNVGVTYAHKTKCAFAASELNETTDKTLGVYAKTNVMYVCILQPKPGDY